MNHLFQFLLVILSSLSSSSSHLRQQEETNQNLIIHDTFTNDAQTMLRQILVLLIPTNNQQQQHPNQHHLLPKSNPNTYITDDSSQPNMEVMYKTGFYFEYHVRKLEPDMSFFLTFSDDDDNHHCEERNDYGDNKCRWDWGETVLGSFTGSFSNVAFEEGYTFGMKTKIYYVDHWGFTCPACGNQNCTLTDPEGNDHSHSVPECPIVFNNSMMNSTKFNVTLPDTSPTDGTYLPMSGDFFVKDGSGTSVIDIGFFTSAK